MEHKMIYSISGATYENLDKMKAAGIIDFHLVVHAGSAPNLVFAKICNDLGVSPCFQNGNDGIAGCSGDCNAYYKRIAEAGYHGAGGESEQNAEMHAIMNNLIFTNFGGEGLVPLSNIFRNQLPEGASGHGISSWLETYKMDVRLYPDEVVESAVIAKQKGCKEVGFMIGWWMPVTAAPYIAMARAMEAKGYQCDGFNVWLGFGSSMWNNYQKWAGVFRELMAIWPPNMTPMKQRFEGVTPPTPPTPVPTPTVAPADFTFGIHAMDAQSINFVGQTLDIDRKPLANAQIQIHRSNVHGAPLTFLGAAVSDATGAWSFKGPIIKGCNYFWLVTKDGKKGYWTTDVVWV